MKYSILKLRKSVKDLDSYDGLDSLGMEISDLIVDLEVDLEELHKLERQIISKKKDVK